MTDFTVINEWLGIDLSLQQALAFRFLEKHGKKYMVHFGHENAIEKARELAKNEPKNRERFL